MALAVTLLPLWGDPPSLVQPRRLRWPFHSDWAQGVDGRHLHANGLLDREYLFSIRRQGLIINVNKPLARCVPNDVGHHWATGSIRPVSTTTMSISGIEAASRPIQAGKDTGRRVLRLGSQEFKVSWLDAFIDVSTAGYFN